MLSVTVVEDALVLHDQVTDCRISYGIVNKLKISEPADGNLTEKVQVVLQKIYLDVEH